MHQQIYLNMSDENMFEYRIAQFMATSWLYFFVINYQFRYLCFTDVAIISAVLSHSGYIYVMFHRFSFSSQNCVLICFKCRMYWIFYWTKLGSDLL